MPLYNIYIKKCKSDFKTYNKENHEVFGYKSQNYSQLFPRATEATSEIEIKKLYNAVFAKQLI